MSIQFSAGDVPTAALDATEFLLKDAVEDLAAALLTARTGADAGLKSAIAAIGDLKKAFKVLMEERTRVEQFRKQIAGDVGTGGLDLDSARDEIGRRLACLRDAR